MGYRMWITMVIVLTAAVATLLTGAAYRGQAGDSSPALAAAAQQSANQSDSSQAQAAKPQAEPSAAKPEAQPRVEQLHVEAGVVTITTAPKATAEDLGVAVFAGAREKESSVWRMKPPQGDEWMLAMGGFTSTAALESLEQFYRNALGQPEVRRSQSEGQMLVVLSRVKGREAIVVRISTGRASEPATILIRRVIKGAPVELEPAGAPKPLPPGSERWPQPRERSISAY